MLVSDYPTRRRNRLVHMRNHETPLTLAYGAYREIR
jgi:hypothetical protein